MKTLYLLVPLAPLFGAVVAGFFGRAIGRAGAHWVTILSVLASFLASCWIFADVLEGNTFNGSVYTWLSSGGVRLEIGFLIDRLTALMMVVVTFVALMVHVYTIGYMAEDPGYQRFFAYISLFTFSMLMLVMANNFLQLFFGWEAVGVVSYLLIGFWYTRPTAVYANLKAFIVNRIGDFGFLLGIALILAHTGTLDYAEVFAQAPKLAADALEIIPGTPWLAISVICICLFIGAMGKSAQFPLHVWLPDSMEGPTPISALIHAATMVTAGIFMVARMSPLFEFSDAARSVVIVIGGITAFFMALIAIVNYDIKRVVAYSTLSHLGYMTVALGASVYPVAMFHLYTHAFFKAALFLAAGSVIIALHHEQDMRKMGGLRHQMPITFLTMWIGTLALIGFPGFSGFFSKDMIIEAVRRSTTPGSGFAYLAVLSGVFVTAFYSFRLLFLTFYGKPRMDEHTASHVHESPWVVTVPLILLAIPSVVIGLFAFEPLLIQNFFGASIKVAPQHDVVARFARDYHGIGPFVAHGFQALPFFLAAGGFGLAWLFYIRSPHLPDLLAARAKFLYTLLLNKYFADEANEFVFARGARALGRLLWRGGDIRLIDGLAVNGTARLIGWVSTAVRQVQSGYVYHYAFVMIAALVVIITLFLHR